MRRLLGAEGAASGTIGAILLFGVLVTTLALLNITAVPDAGRAAEDEHRDEVLGAMSGLQSDAEAAALPGGTGASVSRTFPLSPPRDAGQDFFSFFMAQPARASGQIAFDVEYGNVRLTHLRDGSATTFVDVGSLTEPFPIGRLHFDPHPIFRAPGVVALENGGVVATEGSSELMRHDPPILVDVASGTTHVLVKVRVLNGTSESVGGSSSLRASLTTEASVLNVPPANNARSATLVLETAYGSAWGAFLNETSDDAGLGVGTGYTTAVSLGTGGQGLDVVTWTVEGTGSGNDLRLGYGVAVYRVKLS